MNKVYGLKSEFIPIRSDRSRLIVAYNCKPLEDDVHAIWYEIYFYKKPYSFVSSENIKSAIIADINARTDEKILSGFVWQGKNVWLSSENQFNFKAAYDLSIQTQGQNLPLKFKLGENEDNEPVYHTFNTVEELNEFYLSAIAFIQRCLNEGWELKDSIDFSVYKTN